MNFLTQPQFDQGVVNWLNTIVNPKAALSEVFLNPDGDHRLVNVTYPAKEIVRLVSTVGAQYIQARFVVLSSGEAQPKLSFCVVLYATDVNDKRISPYYLSEPGTATTHKGDDKGVMNEPATTVPHYIVEHWLKSWAEMELNNAMFSNSYGPLQGYTFTLSDLLQPLFNATDSDKDQLGIDLALHEYYKVDAVYYSYTFGLVLRLYGNSKPTGNYFYDMSAPCPPTY